MNDNRDPQDIRSIGIDLAPWGTNQWALTRQQSLLVLDQLLLRGIPVLGGDVILKIENDFRYTYDNWSCEKRDDESQDVFVQRSVFASKEYITRYAAPRNGELYFVIVYEQLSNPPTDLSSWLP